MKQVLKIVGGFLIGILMGLVVAGVGLVLFGDMSFSEYIGKFLRLNAMEVIGIPLLSLVCKSSCTKRGIWFAGWLRATVSYRSASSALHGYAKVGRCA